MILATWSSSETRDFYPLAAAVVRIWLSDGARERTRQVGRLRVLLTQVLRLRALLREERPAAILSFIDTSNILTLFAALGLGMRTIVAERTSPAVNRNVRQPWRLLRRLCYSWAVEVVAQTRDAALWLQRNCRVNALVIPNSLRELPELRLDREPLIIGVGRLHHEKGFDVLLRAFAQIRAEFPHWRLAILGEGPERGSLERLRAELGLAASVDIVGEVRDVEIWMARAGLLVHPSRREGFPNTVLEAMGMGAPVICADCHSGPAELIQDGHNGRLVPVDDLERLVLVMRELLHDPQARARLGAAAAQVRRAYEPSRIIGLWENCLLPMRVVPP